MEIARMRKEKTLLQSNEFPSRNSKPIHKMEQEESFDRLTEIAKTMIASGLGFEDDALGPRALSAGATSPNKSSQGFILSTAPTTLNIREAPEASHQAPDEDSEEDETESSSVLDEERPIKPMASTAIYDARFADLKFKDSSFYLLFALNRVQNYSKR
ncbi:hypothetical protein Ciccas_001731 [Cichlidogyrus casuarinus]|uniref:Uncharacterized protein n=1 Tax=Cichlidogyrus casuarinus TaxID=1844966 RepID=A0ABD2QJA9_9PLAT